MSHLNSKAYDALTCIVIRNIPANQRVLLRGVLAVLLTLHEFCLRTALT